MVTLEKTRTVKVSISFYSEYGEAAADKLEEKTLQRLQNTKRLTLADLAELFPDMGMRHYYVVTLEKGEHDMAIEIRG